MKYIILELFLVFSLLHAGTWVIDAEALVASATNSGASNVVSATNGIQSNIVKATNDLSGDVPTIVSNAQQGFALPITFYGVVTNSGKVYMLVEPAYIDSAWVNYLYLGTSGQSVQDITNIILPRAYHLPTSLAVWNKVGAPGTNINMEDRGLYNCRYISNDTLGVNIGAGSYPILLDTDDQLNMRIGNGMYFTNGGGNIVINNSIGGDDIILKAGSTIKMNAGNELLFWGADTHFSNAVILWQNLALRGGGNIDGEMKNNLDNFLRIDCSNLNACVGASAIGLDGYTFTNLGIPTGSNQPARMWEVWKATNGISGGGITAQTATNIANTVVTNQPWIIQVSNALYGAISGGGINASTATNIAQAVGTNHGFTVSATNTLNTKINSLSNWATNIARYYEDYDGYVTNTAGTGLLILSNSSNVIPAGTYYVTFQGIAQFSTTSGDMIAFLANNGTEIPGARTYVPAPSGSSYRQARIEIHSVVTVNGTDWIALYFNTDTGTADLVNTETYFVRVQ